MQLNENVAELIGAIAGDGYIYRKNKKYRIGFTGHPVTDLGYFEYLKQLIKQEWNKDGKIINRGNRIDIVINSKNACLFLTEELKILYGEGKSLKFVMPDLIKNNEDLAKAFIRGVFDTDGTVFAVKKPGIEKYPSIELTTINRIMAQQIKQILEERGFRVSKVWQFEQTMSKNLCYRFGLYGQKNLKKWVDEIGFSNPYKLERALNYLKKV